MFSLDPESSLALVVQIVAGFRRVIEEGTLRAGSKAPSIRQFAHAHGVSVFTVVDAYDRLVALGYFASRPHSGFFVKQRPLAVAGALGHGPGFSFDSMWYLRRIFENRALRMKPGCGWLPSDWLFQEGVRRGLRTLAADNADLGGYGEPKGYPPLRLVRAGDAVLVDEPGYPNLLFSLRFLGARLIGVPRTAAGYDLAALERLVLEHQPRVFFTQPRLQSPTGSVAQLAHLHRVVQLAEKHDFRVVENDIYADLDPEPRPSLASLDQLNRVVYISSFSKTISPNIRVGYLAANPDLLEDLAQLKMLSGLTSSEFSERVAHGALIDGRWRKHIKGLRERLAKAHEGAASSLLKLGFEIFLEPKAGIFLWARHPAIADATELASKASEQDILLGPGHLFSPDLQPSPWFRFNVAFCDDPAVFAFLRQHVHTP